MPTMDLVLLIVILVIVLVLFVTEFVPIPVTALLAAALLMVTGILTPEEALSGFSSRATITVLAVFVLSAGLERTGGVHYLTEALLRWAGKDPRRQVGVLGALVGPVSGFVNNTAVVAVMIPPTMRLAWATGKSPSRLLMPLSFIAMLGGTLTVIGTSTNLLGLAIMSRRGLEPFGFFEFFSIGLVALVVGTVWLVLVGIRFVPDRGGKRSMERFDLKGFLAEFKVPEDAEVVGKTLPEAGLTREEGLQVVRVVRGGRERGAPEDEKDLRIRASDMLLIQGGREDLERLPDRTGLVPREETRYPGEAPDETEERLVTAEVIITPGSSLDGRTLGQVRFLQRYAALVLAVRHHGRTERGSLWKHRLAVGDVLLVQATPDTLDTMAEKPDFVITRERGRMTYRVGRLPIAIGIMAAVVTIAAVGVLPIVTTALSGAVAMVLMGCLKMEEFIDAIRWDVVLLLAGVIPLGVAFEKTGGALLVASGLGALGAHLSPYLFMVVLFVITSLVTEMMSNNASAVLLIPIAIVTAASVGADPRAFVLTVMLAASTSMLTPLGYQTNTMVYAPGGYRFNDFARVGWPLNLIMAFVIPAAIRFLL